MSIASVFGDLAGLRERPIPLQDDVRARWKNYRAYPIDKMAPQFVKDAQRRYMMRYGGPCGLTESDDMENWNYAAAASKGTIAKRYPYNFIMGAGHAWTDDRAAPGMTLNYEVAEENQRSRLRRWLEFMEAGSWEDIYPVNPVSTARADATKAKSEA
jgi:hypothetical protein